MNVNISVTVGNMIWCYDLDNHIKFEKIIDNIVITASDIYLKADSYDDVICTYKELDSNKPDAGDRLYFSSKEKRDDYITNSILTDMSSKGELIMKNVTFSNAEILVLKEYLNCNPCETCCILDDSSINCDELDNDGNYKCYFKKITKSIIDKLGLNVDVPI